MAKDLIFRQKFSSNALQQGWFKIFKRDFGNVAYASIQYVQDIMASLDVELNNIIGPLAQIVDKVKFTIIKQSMGRKSCPDPCGGQAFNLLQ